MGKREDNAILTKSKDFAIRIVMNNTDAYPDDNTDDPNSKF